MVRDKKTQPALAVLAMILAWIVPGAGHAYLGRWKRAAIIFFTLGATFWAGVAMGGVMTVSPLPSERWWFMADMFTGVHGVAAWQMQQRVFERIEDEIQTQVTQRSEAFLRAQGLPASPANAAAANARYRGELAEAKLMQENLALVSPVDSVARAYCGVAGLLNLMCIFDALMLGLMGLHGEKLPEQPQQAQDEEKA